MAKDIERAASEHARRYSGPDETTVRSRAVPPDRSGWQFPHRVTTNPLAGLAVYRLCP